MSDSAFARLSACLLLSLPLPALACGGALHVAIEHDGVYALEHASIISAQPSLADCSSDQLVLTHLGEPVPIRVIDGGDGRFGAGDRIEWVGQQLHGPESWFDAYSITNAYVLSAKPGAHARIVDIGAAGKTASRAALTRRVHLEQDDLMIRLDQTQQKPGEEPDVWQWTKLTHADPQPFTTAFDLPDVDMRGRETRVTLNFRGMSRFFAPGTHKDVAHPQHVVELAINGRPLKPVSWDGRDEVRLDIAVPTANFKAKGNTLTLSVPKRPLPWKPDETTVDVVMFNWVELDFPIEGRLDAGASPLMANSNGAIELESSAATPPVLYGEDGTRRIASAAAGSRFAYAGAKPGVVLHPVINNSFLHPVAIRALAEDRWSHPGTGYDYLIVSHASLIDSIRPLAEFHERGGLKVAIVDVQDVYDTFNGGITHPRAIRELVKHAHHEWPSPKARFLLLVGDASFDIRHDTYNDLAYAKFANNPTELAFPGHFAGIPGTQYDATSKRMASRNLIPTWQFPSPEGQSASDNPYGTVDEEGIHPVVAVGRFPVVEPDEVKAIVDKTIGYMTKPQPGSWRRDVMFITDEADYFKKASDQIADAIASEGFLADKIYASANEADNIAHQSAIKDGINNGQLLVHFIGHGGRYIWRTGPPDIRKNHDLFTLEDVSGLKNADRLPMILSMTCYSAPFDNPTEDSIGERFLREADKGAVAIFAASWRNAPSTEFSKALVRELLTPGATIGEGIVRAKGAIKDRVLIEMYNLLGDPAIVLERPKDSAQLAWRGDRWSPTLGVALPGTSFDGQVDVDWLDAAGMRVAGGRYRIAQTRFDLPVPALADGTVIASARVYASNLLSGRDATASFDVGAATRRDAALAEQPSWWARMLTRAPPPAPPRPRAADTISREGFEAEESSTLVAGN